MATKNLIQIGDPRLYQKSKNLKRINAKHIESLVSDLRKAMHDLNLIGFAAPQLGVMERVFITEVRRTPYRKVGLDKFRVYINPKITWFSKEEVTMYEGCGSILKGQLFGKVKRPKKIEITYLDENGTSHTQKFDGILGRVIQHEYDHLDGILFTEKVTNPKTLIDREHYVQLMGRK